MLGEQTATSPLGGTFSRKSTSKLKKSIGNLMSPKPELPSHISPSFQEKKTISVDALKGNIQITSKAALSPLFDALVENKLTFTHVNMFRISSQIAFIKVKEILVKQAIMGVTIPPGISQLINLTVL
jgi:hypothetical protein